MTPTLTRALTAAVLSGAIAVGVSSCGAYDDQTKTCTVSGKDRVHVAKGASEMRVYTDDCGTFVVSDSLVKGQWRSADLFGSLKEGRRYVVTFHGYRNGFLSMFPNITEATEVRS